jgi:hypothetical protein
VAVAFAGGLLRPGSLVRAAVTTLLETDQPPLSMLEGFVEPPRGALQLAERLIA